MGVVSSSNWTSNFVPTAEGSRTESQQTQAVSGCRTVPTQFPSTISQMAIFGQRIS